MLSRRLLQKGDELYRDILIAGFGGQGIIFAGKLLAWAGLREGKEVVFYPSYGAEMRGGTAHCTVIISDSLIPSPIVSRPQSAILMNYPALEKFLPRIRDKGPIVINTSLIEKRIGQEGVRMVGVPANNIAEKLGNAKVANVVALGVWAHVAGAVTLESLILSLREVLSPDKGALLKVNENSLREGWRFASDSS